MYERQAHNLPFKPFSTNVALTSHSKIHVGAISKDTCS